MLEVTGLAKNPYIKEVKEVEVQLLQTIILEKFGINTTIGTHAGQYRIRVAKKSIPTLQALVGPHLPPMMAYRAGL